MLLEIARPSRDRPSIDTVTEWIAENTRRTIKVQELKCIKHCSNYAITRATMFGYADTEKRKKKYFVMAVWNKRNIQLERHCCNRNGKHKESWTEKDTHECLNGFITLKPERDNTESAFVLWLLVVATILHASWCCFFFNSTFLIMTEEKRSESTNVWPLFHTRSIWCVIRI